MFCRITFLVSYACGICALLLLWAVYPKDYDMGQAAGNSISFYDAQRVGTLPADNRIPWRSNSLTYEGSSRLGFPDLTGGWMHGGDLGESAHNEVPKSEGNQHTVKGSRFSVVCETWHIHCCK